ncbi:MAG: hypothetical protein E7358_00120 [Clostridiales bacterium]|nr:hypothetical protein [Clostridiales bacterium]
MYSQFKFNLKKFSIALLSLLMAIMLAFSVACSDGNSSSNDDDDDSSTTTESTITDYQSIKNGDFEFGTEDATSFPYSSSINWTRNLYSDVTSAPSSSATSGIIDTEKEAFDKIKQKIKLNENPSTPYEFGFVADEYDYEDKDKQVNPQVKGTKILMINNNKNDEGTAQYFRASSSISVPAGEYHLLSFWVKTVDLKSMYSNFAGAHIKLTSSNSSVTYEELSFDDVNTNGQWVKFEIAIQGSEVSSTTLNFTLGLGKGNGLDHNEFVNGFAFLDNVNVKGIEKTDYDAFVSSSINHTVSDPKNIQAVSLKNQTYATNEKGVATSFTTYKANLNYNVLTSSVRNDGQGSESINFIETTNDFNYDYKTGNVIGFGSASQAKGASANVSAMIGDNANKFTNFIYMDFVNPSVASYQSKTYELKAGKFDLVTFYAKVNSKNFNSDKLTVKVLNDDNDPIELFKSIDTTDVESVRYGDFIKYQAFINNPTDKDTTYSIKLIYGYDGVWEESYALQQGVAIVADFTVASSDEESYNLATAGERLIKQQIYGEYVSYGKVTDDTSNDMYGISVDKTQSFTIKEKPATNVNGYTFKTTASDKSKVQYGIINSAYYNTSNYTYGESGGVTFRNPIVNFKDLKVSNNKHAQVLVLDNKEATYSRFVSEIKTVSKNSSSKVIVKIRTYGNAVANVSLVNSALEGDHYDVISFSNEKDSVNLTSKVTKDSYLKGGWTYVYFYVTAGNEDLDFRIEISNGSHSEASEGTIITEGANVLTVDANAVKAEMNAIRNDFAVLQGDEYAFSSLKHTRAPSTVKNTGENGEVVEYTQYYPELEIYSGNAYAKFASYETLHADSVIDNTTDVEEDKPEEDSHDHNEGYNLTTDVALQISSIIIALVLIAVIIVILIRNALKKRAKKLEKQATYYEEDSGFNRDTREKVMQKIAEKKLKKEKEIELADDDDVTEYDYSEAEQIDETEEVIEEEVTEETSDEITLEVEGEEVSEETTETVETEQPAEEENKD